MSKRICKVCGVRCQYPGKFEGNECQTVAAILYDMLGEGCEAEQFGECDGPMGAWSLILLDDKAVRQGLSDGTTVTLAPAYIVTENSDGFMDYSAYDSEEEAREDWTKGETEYAGCCVEEEEGEACDECRSLGPQAGCDCREVVDRRS